ncbi:flagellar hook protein FlgE [Nitrospirales bacterium NOB]|nr:MAG: flagellar hook protein FlgE [Nitrospira sp. OLB3]MBV6470521.1 Flagellar hook protein FlgE [Nitrospirota bacterium]MCE7965677.1 flagellar hook protein FlgE [Nitrospira sp. NTP2]MDL1889048.1 flagellar hook protein FlgE [Nitrospirales bacterium NOB]MEB2338573.1 flagellar hook protein FlgE [Nitrospirales bacterium]RIK59019.1 MAG: flagellar hook protein FlgE [Nitrospira sp.]
MGILTSMFTAVTGLSSYGNAMGVIGNNIANVGTAGFKSSRATFSELISSSLAGGSGNDQIGLGVYMNDVQKNFSQGSMTTTGNTFDLAIDGSGFYLLRNSAGANFYARAGQFTVDSLGQVVDSSGALLQGYQADTNGNITSTIGGITLSSSAVSPQATSSGEILGNLNANATAPSAAFSESDATTYNFATSMTFYDSLGNGHQLQLFFRKTAANTWGVYSQIDGGAAAAQTAMTFNASGALTAGGTQTITATLTNGATSPQTVTLDLSSMTQYGSASGVISQTQDGYSSGSLDRITVDEQGRVVGQFTNGQTRALAQVVLNRFTNPDGLSNAGENHFIETLESGAALVGAPTVNGLGRILSGTVEQSNVDLGKEFVDMIITQRAFQANSRAITTSDEMLQELVNLKR